MKKNCCGVKNKEVKLINQKEVIIHNHTAILNVKSKKYCQISQLKKNQTVTSTGTSDLAAKKDFIDLKAEVHKVGINKLVNVSTSLNRLKTEVDDLDVGILKTVVQIMKLLKTQNATHLRKK